MKTKFIFLLTMLTQWSIAQPTGVFGVGSPFDIMGTPLPLIQVVDVPPTISKGSDLPINIKGRGN